MSEPHYLTATEMAHLIRTRQVSAVELLQAHLDRIEQVNPRVNAIVTLVAEQALDAAKAADAAEPAGPLHGVPVAHKDLVDTKGIRTTYGSPLHADFVPDQDDVIVERLRAAGAITVGKTNTPEFGTGSHTVNEVFGATRNPYDLSRSAGGSSGGAAAALASGMVPLAD
uniref:amidase n=1 Tax=Nonomuraea rhizosphaerae TaxID=2665663 RepID=UPI0027E284F4